MRGRPPAKPELSVTTSSSSQFPTQRSPIRTPSKQWLCILYELLADRRWSHSAGGAVASETPARLLRTEGTGGVIMITKCVWGSVTAGDWQGGAWPLLYWPTGWLLVGRINTRNNIQQETFFFFSITTVAADERDEDTLYSLCVLGCVFAFGSV